jgi:hypothetical protein
MKLNDILQWAGAAFIIAGHSLNAVGPVTYPCNMFGFFLGTILFMLWSIRVANKPQLIVCLVSLGIIITGLYRALV